jgi:hypothetical protein
MAAPPAVRELLAEAAALVAHQLVDDPVGDAGVWVPESRSWVLSCEVATGVAGPR